MKKSEYPNFKNFNIIFWIFQKLKHDLSKKRGFKRGSWRNSEFS